MDMLTFIYPLRKQWTLSQVSTDAQNHFLGLEDEGGKQKGIWQDLKCMCSGNPAGLDTSKSNSECWIWRIKARCHDKDEEKQSCWKTG